MGTNSNFVTNNITVQALFPPICSFTYIAPELTGPRGQPQTLTQGQNATAVVILTPAVGGAAYPTGTVTLTDALTSNTTTVTLPETTDTISIPLGILSVGTHTFTATYSGDSNYTLTGGQTAYSPASPASAPHSATPSAPLRPSLPAAAPTTAKPTANNLRRSPRQPRSRAAVQAARCSSW